MPTLQNWVQQQLANHTAFSRSLKYATDRGLTELDPWLILTSAEDIRTRSEAINSRYPGRRVFCFAERQDTDDVACLVLSDLENEAENILVVHDFAKPGSEVDATFADFWEWFKAAVDDLVDTFRDVERIENLPGLG